ncbi:ABC transporter family protein [Bacillus pseudomycoides]|uniref:ABC transporter ATP-binding protein n=1 Tax=Bacillus pseudomycoides TaxID=64104 RepID=UPI0004ED730E|nr:ABC transporter ATP-binding protein [Bacillus pseudomycoides]AIK40100.1 ABC transporter family protein [Bacillus pseudomycoides]AJI19016.1 ABC transporter family protein [Bacillus pseudomycoides]MEB3057218.1 ABC transporter ATP-binding protein [Bacillus pseudomycoides]
MFLLNDVTYKDILHIPYLEIHKEKITCIIGESGSGKSTLLRMLNDLQSPTAGEIEYNGAPISSYPPIQLRREVVMLGQTPPIFDGTVKDNLLMGLRFSEKPFPTNESLQEALAIVSLEKDLTHIASSLSGGEKQRLSLARVLLMDPPVYLLDEPTSALDADTERRVMKQFTAITRQKKKTVIFITHSQHLPEEIADDMIEISKTKGAIRREVHALEGRY